MTARASVGVRASRTAMAMGAAGLAGVLSGGPAAADVPVVNQESVLVRLDATGHPRDARLLSQVTATGHGRVTIEDPTATTGLRSLDGFTAPPVSDDEARYALDVNGRTTRRTVADYDKALPIEVGAEYTLDGRPLEPRKLTGARGLLAVKYRIHNVSAQSTDITYEDGHGKPVTEAVDVMTPFVAQLTTTLPPTFTGLEAPGAEVTGDGEGGVRLSWTMVLFEPLGKSVQELGWKAAVDGGDFPAVQLTAVPVKPEASPALHGSAATLKTTALTAARLTGAVTSIDEKPGDLQTGAGDLLAGLHDLADGASQLRAGLEDEAAPGARQLAEGLGEAHGGADRLS